MVTRLNELGVKMNILSFKRLFLLIIVSASSMLALSQSNDAFQKLQEISMDEVFQKKRDKQRAEQDEEYVNDSIFMMFDVDIDLSLGDITSDLSWGDPVKNPQIRCNRASNLYGPVRYNSNGTVRWHRGFDYYAPQGTPVFSVGEGTVSLVQTHPDFGLCVLVTHKRPKKIYYSFYAHLSSVSVAYGQKVQKGTQLGKSGVTGNAYNLKGKEQHLHFEYRTSPKHSDRKQENPNAIVKTKFRSANPKGKRQSEVGVVKEERDDFFNFM